MRADALPPSCITISIPITTEPSTMADRHSGIVKRKHRFSTTMANLLVCAAALTASWHALADERADFLKYLNGPVYDGPIAEPKLRTAQDREFARNIRDGAAVNEVTFASHYILWTFDCGHNDNCMRVFALDAKTGNVYWLPTIVREVTITEDSTPTDFRSDSRLLVVNGKPDGQPRGRYRYLFENGKFRLLDKQIGG
ncbi:hypothetical protein [Burkholderia sola]|uniref:hypothetical protein n=1 Tax=Burkholderia sola TaxID=2843302 RepID=UPI0023DDD9DA|nr:hypothetical protein [Burkholderia sola]MDF3080319.1 hypothetical protein [Burkholderia sola]